MTKTITRLFDNYADAAEAIRELESIGVPRDDISVIANNVHGEHVHEGVTEGGAVAAGTSAGAVLGGAGGVLAGLGMLAIPGLGPIVAAGWLAAAAVGAGVGAVGGAAAGGIVGALKHAGHSDEEAQIYSEGVRRGGVLLSAKVNDAEVARANAAVDTVGSVDIAARGARYRESGWTRFDENAPVYSAEEVEQERVRYGLTPRY
ncbi:hypothetical protein EDF56_10219 [Novosphingobium sp. PhB165]|uniref:general stress protein n=1 Tax=Novosphingobium sp. PhB165 TaxID=2485105 RepID=UPI0010466B20|nr:general stress protein [Novosphingobium sp. PhB165]TCM20359.1 hypothetical protein EDF56_10219 [Novosphingobium sp. PhB165]